jgi:hypothetical protein
LTFIFKLILRSNFFCINEKELLYKNGKYS